MTRPRVRITIRTLMGAVAVAGWIIFNGRLIHGVITDQFALMPVGWSGRVIVFTALAWLIGPAAAVGAAFRGWSELIKEGRNPAWSGLVAGSAAGFAGWYMAGILLCIGQGSFTGVLLGGPVLGLTGVLINLPTGLLAGAAWGWRHRRRNGETGWPTQP